MRFSCEQNTLVKALNIVSKAVTSRTTIPILKGILLTVKDGKLTMSASDLEIGIEKTIEVDDAENGSVVVQAKLFSDIIRKLPNSTVEVTEDNNNINIRCSKTNFDIVGNEADEFPKIMIETTSEDILFDKEIFCDMVNKVSFSASADESRGVLTGILIEMKEDSLNMVSLDGFRMAITRESISNENEKNILISSKILSEVSKIITDENPDGDVIFRYNNKKALFVVGNTKVVVSLLDGEFVKYRDILPKDQSITVVLNRQDMLEAIERASLLAKVGKNNLVRLTINDEFMEITSKSEEGNDTEEVMVSKDGNDILIGFNSKYLIDALKVIDDSEIKMILNTPVSPCLIKPVSGDSYCYLILPVRINMN